MVVRDLLMTRTPLLTFDLSDIPIEVVEGSFRGITECHWVYIKFLDCIVVSQVVDGLGNGPEFVGRERQPHGTSYSMEVKQKDQ